MNLLYNGLLLHEDELKIPATNRAFQYNDGFFETMMIANGKIRFWQDHLYRMQAAAIALKMNLPNHFRKPAFEEQLLHLAENNLANDFGRLKLKVWRGGAGLYTPETNLSDWLVTIKPAIAPSDSLDKVGICTTVKTHYSPYSFFKGPFSLQYVMAGIEKQERGYDDVIILNRQDLISELTSSNIFWYQQDTLYTPALETGCINGIMRRHILRVCLQEGINIKEAYYDVESILQADAVFSSNVTGIKEIKNLISFDLDTGHEIIGLLRNSIR